jgi:hypothetical protein
MNAPKIYKLHNCTCTHEKSHSIRVFDICGFAVWWPMVAFIDGPHHANEGASDDRDLWHLVLGSKPHNRLTFCLEGLEFNKPLTTTDKIYQNAHS